MTYCICIIFADVCECLFLPYCECDIGETHFAIKQRVEYPEGVVSGCRFKQQKAMHCVLEQDT